MWFLFQIAIMTQIMRSNGAHPLAGPRSGFAVGLLAAFAASWLSIQWMRRKSTNEATAKGASGCLKFQ